jgi:hypothetical protein
VVWDEILKDGIEPSRRTEVRPFPYREVPDKSRQQVYVHLDAQGPLPWLLKKFQQLWSASRREREDQKFPCVGIFESTGICSGLYYYHVEMKMPVYRDDAFHRYYWLLKV